MSTSFEKSVKGGTKIKLAPPKAKYVEHILVATRSGEAGVAEVFRTLQNRLRDSTWTIVFKALIIVHLMIKEGQRDVTLRFLSSAPQTRLAINTFTDGTHVFLLEGVQTQGQNIRRYSNYLLQRAVSFAHTKYDYTQSGALDRMKSITVDKGLLRETEEIQAEIKVLLKCDFFSKEQENEIALMAFRLLTKDLLDLFAAENQAVMNVLSHYFELSKPDAERAIEVYKVFSKQTEQVVHFLSIARSYEHVTRLEIPKIKHAPTSLTKSLEDYLQDPDFDSNRRQFVAAQQGRKGTKFETESFNKSEPASRKPSISTAKTSSAKRPEAAKPVATKGPAPDLIDFFGSIEQNQTPMAQETSQQYQQPAATGYQQPQQYPQQPANGFQQEPTQTNPFGQFPPSQSQQQQPLQSQYTGIGFGGYGPQPQQQFVQPTGYQDPSQQAMQQPNQPPMQPQFTMQQQSQPAATNPFRQSMMMTGQVPYQQTQQTGVPQQAMQQQPMQQQSTNPFARLSQPNAQPTGGFGQEATQQFSAPQIQPQQTGTNPFARAQQPQPAASNQPAPLQPMVTGSTNPFRQSQFVNQQTGRGWQTEQQNTMGGWENVQTTPVFPRPGQ